MAEGMLGGMLGGEEEKPEVEAAEPLAGAEAFAAAVAAKLAGGDPEVARDTSAFLKKQAQLLETQNKHLEEEHALRLAHLRNQLREERIRRVGMRLRVGFQLFFVLVATVIGIGALLMIRNAMEAHGVVIDAFQVPPDLAQRGLTGEVLAKQVLDQLTEMAAASSANSARPANSYSSNCGRDLKVEIPETGVSFGELSRYLHETIGHESHISGEVYETSTGITVTARAGEEPARSFDGRSGEIDQLVGKAAESIYEQTQPFRYANYLYFIRGRRDEAFPIFKRLSTGPDPVDRAWAHMDLG